MTADESEDLTYQVFFSYRRPYRRVAQYLERRLHAIAKRHIGRNDDFRVFLDCSSLKPGILDDNIYAALRGSRYLVVLLDRATSSSQWVANEIKYWLENGGSVNQLYLVRADAGAELIWKDGRFCDTGAVPAPLVSLFRSVPKWIEFTGRASFWRYEDGLEGLCAALLGAEPAQFRLIEQRNQRAVIRVRSALMAIMAILAVAATIFAFDARTSANQALAQADAAEALLTADGTPTLAIERALRAAARSDSPTVRSAMLAVSQLTRRLTRAFPYPEAETGNRVTGLRFSGDGRALAAWGRDKEPGTSRVLAWSVATGALQGNVTVPAVELRDIALLDSQFLAACSASGPLLVDLVAASTTQLISDWGDGAGRTCEIREFADGAVLLGASVAGGAAHVVDVNGRTRRLDGVTSIAAHPAARSVVLTGPSGIVKVTVGGATTVSTRPGAQAVFADANGNFVVGWNPQEWGFIRQSLDGVALQLIPVPEATVNVAPLFDFSQMTGELGWITEDGTVGWTGGPQNTRVYNAEGEPAWAPYATRLVPLDSAFVAVFRNTATVLRPPGVLIGGTPPSLEWTQTVVADRIGSAAVAGAEPVLATCSSHRLVLLATDLPEGGSMLLDESGRTQGLAGRGAFDAGCGAVDVGTDLTAVPSLGSFVRPGLSESTVVRANLIADAVAVAPVGDQVALARSGLPVEILSTLPDEDLARPWDVTGGQGGSAVTALGERELFAEDALVVADASGVVDRVALPQRAELVAVRPDGTGAVLREFGSDAVLLAGRPESLPANLACRGPVTYLPEPNFASSLDAAEAQIPVVRTEHGFVDCRNGRTVAWDLALTVIDYNVGARAGRIVTRSEAGTVVTTWTRGDSSSLRTADPLPGDAVSFDESGQIALTHRDGGREVTLHRRDGAAWRREPSVVTGLPMIVAAQVVDAGTLMLAVAPNGGFELFDVATRRLVASDPAPSIDLTGTAGFTARRVGDYLAVALTPADDPTTFGTIELPVGIPALRRQLCALYPAPECRQ